MQDLKLIPGPDLPDLLVEQTARYLGMIVSQTSLTAWVCVLADSSYKLFIYLGSTASEAARFILFVEFAGRDVACE